jgi:pilus assembly protein CpaC
MIAGLLSNNAQNTIDKTPGAGDIPILGNLFRSTEFRKGQTELVIVVTPYLVRPVNDGDIALPTDGFQTPTAAAQFLLNQDHGGNAATRRPGPRAADEPASPEIGMAPQQDHSLAADNRRLRAKDEQRAEAVTPGFSLR